ncbi:MAG: hypothetical protein KatS3mg109_0083 [Pirellulaceae bacterium]|nr:MAG: hypothetical protein KatS3mg109_0083 [Pirellulaceae bacterium]
MTNLLATDREVAEEALMALEEGRRQRERTRWSELKSRLGREYRALTEAGRLNEAQKLAEAAAAKHGIRLWSSHELQTEKLKIRAKTMAEKNAIKVWPALIGISCDPKAIKIAEEVLAAEHGSYYGRQEDGSFSYAGWDQQEYHGLSGRQVQEMWFAAGCRDGRKFRLQLKLRMVATAGESCAAFLQRVRGERWLSSNQDVIPPGWFSKKAIRVLGRVSPVARRVLTIGMDIQGRIRIRHLNWDLWRKIRPAVEAENPRVIVAFQGTRAALVTAGIRSEIRSDKPSDAEISQLVRFICPAYPEAELDQARQLVAGRTPMELSGGVLSRKEAHDWLTNYARYSPVEYLERRVSEMVGRPVRHRSVAVLRWVENVCRNDPEPLLRVRRFHTDALGWREVSVYDILDEVSDRDIPTGREGVHRVMEAVAGRMSQEALDRAMKETQRLAAVAAWSKKLPKGVRLLNTPRELAVEGQEMGHCVAGYADAVARGQCYILSVSTKDGRSTVELSPTLDIIQHRGKDNGRPPRWHKRLIQAWVRRMRA